MKARVKATGEIVSADAMVSFNGDDFYLDELELIQDNTEKTLYDELDEVYWANLKHQAAISAMQAILSSNVMMEILSRRDNGTMEDEVAMEANDYATALVEKFKSENNG